MKKRAATLDLDLNGWDGLGSWRSLAVSDGRGVRDGARCHGGLYLCTSVQRTGFLNP